MSAAGDIDHDALHRQVESSFARIPSKDIVSPSSLPRSQYTGTQIEIRDDSKPLCHVAFATESVGWTDPRYFVFTVSCVVCFGLFFFVVALTPLFFFSSLGSSDIDWSVVSH